MAPRAAPWWSTRTGARRKTARRAKKKDRYDVKALTMFNVRNIGKTQVLRKQETKMVSVGLNGLVFEASLASLQNDKVVVRKFKLITEDAHEGKKWSD
ncbi:rCG25386 [Rattus norvegicus]|uniref:RCG25386 n=1 Tax=Rattus norvegicus TaxID=10116 RepID=A6I1L4_RAT|nr:rCG25386 [Rattus norvegicus]